MELLLVLGVWNDMGSASPGLCLPGLQQLICPAFAADSLQDFVMGVWTSPQRLLLHNTRCILVCARARICAPLPLEACIPHDGPRRTTASSHFGVERRAFQCPPNPNEFHRRFRIPQMSRLTTGRVELQL